MAQGAYILGCAGPSLTVEETAFFRQAQPWGFILFARNIETPDQVRALTNALRDAVQRDAPVFIDQEGGRVQRMRAPHWREWMPPLEQVAALGKNAARGLWLRYRIIGAELKAVGIDGNCAPLADIATPQTHAFLKNRCYGTTPAQVASAALAVAKGLLAAGVIPVMKHIPGHGRAAMDSHKILPTVDSPRDELWRSDFAVFRDLADLPAAMTAHVVYKAFDKSPATTSQVMVDLIRKEIGFAGLLMTDDISMNALSGSAGERSVAALKAGCDLVLHCNGNLAEMQTIASLCGMMTPAAKTRAETALACRDHTDGIDIGDADAEFQALLKGGIRV